VPRRSKVRTVGKRKQSKRKAPTLVRIPDEYLEAIEFGNVLFPSFYQFENGLRILIDAYLASCYGADWWNLSLQASLPKIHQYSADQQKKMDKMPWIGDSTRVKVLPVHLVTLGHLEEIVKSYSSDCIPELFPTIEFFLGHMDAIKRVRNLYAHMFPCITKADCSLAKREILTLGTHINSRLERYAAT
jgi:hypothetical protein